MMIFNGGPSMASQEVLLNHFKNNNNMIIALSGIPGVGKDTIGSALQEILNTEKLNHRSHKQFSQGFSIKKFAGVGNEVYTKITGVNYSKLEGEAKEKERPRMIKFLEGMKDIFGQDIWAKGLMGKHNEKSNNWIITDLRYPEELKALQEKDDLFLIRIRRICPECGLMEVHSTDCSVKNITPAEVKLAGYYGWDLILLNDSTPEIAAEKIAHLILTHYNLAS